MKPSEHLAECKWTHPPSYGGFSPEGDYVIYVRTRDSNILDNCNYQLIFKELRNLARTLPEPPDNPNIESGDIGSWVYDFRAGHWACGWVETLLIRQDAPEALLALAGEILRALSDYPIYDESAFSEAEFEATSDYWESLSIAERVEYCREAGESIFAARRDAIPSNMYEHLYDLSL